MAGNASKVTIEFLGKDKSLGKTTRDAEKSTSRLGDRMNKVGRISGRALAGGLVLAGAAAIKMTKSAAEDAEAQAKLANVLRNSTGARSKDIAGVESWISAQGKALGIADDDLRPAIGRLAAATGDLGEAQRLASLAMDVSAGSGKSLEQVTEALQKAQNGSLGGLSRLGVATKDASGKALSLEQVQAKLASTYKGAAAKGADTIAGKQRILSVQFGELREQIGTKLLPVMQKLAEIGLKLNDWISKNVTLVGTMVATIGGLLASVWAITTAVRVWTAATTAWSAISKVAAAAQWLLNAAMTANPIGLVVVAIAGLAAGLVLAYKKSETFRKIVDGAFRGVKNAASAAFSWIRGNWPKLLAIITGPIGLAVYAVAKNWTRIKTGASNAVSWIRDKFNGMVSFFRDIPGRMRNIFGGAFDGLKSAFKSAVNSIIRGWNGLSFGIPGFNPPGPGKFPAIKVNTPNLPLLAKGGTVATAGGVVVGDAGPEILDLPRGARVTPLGHGGGGTTINITVNGAIDPTAVAMQINQILLKRKRTTGQPLGLA